MFRGFWTGATGLRTHQHALDVVSNNIANVNTTGFKTSRLHFQDLFSQTMSQGSEQFGGHGSVNPRQVGVGSAMAAVEKEFRQGAFETTDIATDVAIYGKGFLVYRGATASGPATYYSRDGHLQIDALGGNDPGSSVDISTLQAGTIKLTSAEGYTLQGVNATLNAATGLLELPSSTTVGTPTDIAFDPTAQMPAFATTSVTLGKNLDSTEDIAIDPVILTLEKDGVDNSIRIEFQRAAARGNYFFWKATETTPQPDGTYTQITDSDTGIPLEGVMELDNQGLVTGVYLNGDTDGDDYLSATEVAGLSNWAQDTVTETLTRSASGADSQRYNIADSPVVGSEALTVDGVQWTRVAAFTAAPQEYMLDFNTREVIFGTAGSGDAPAAGSVISLTYQVSKNVFTVGTGAQAVAAEAGPVLAAPAAFTVDQGSFDAGSLAVTMDGVALTSGVDYNETPGTGTITPLTAWHAGSATLSYTANGGAVIVTGETAQVTSANPTKDFTVATPPIAAGTLVVNATRGGAALVEDTDYSVDYDTGAIRPLTLWDAGNVTVDYDRADTRQTIEFALANMDPGSLVFRELGGRGNAAAGTLKSPDEYAAGFSTDIYDSRGDRHQMTFDFEKLDENRWAWTATPTLHENLDSAVVIDSATGGGTAGKDGINLADNLLKVKPTNANQYEISLIIDDGSGKTEWTQIDSNAAFTTTGGSTHSFKVVDPATGEIALSRDLNVDSAISVEAEYVAADITGSGTVRFDANGDFESAVTLEAVTFQPTLASALSITPDFSKVKQTARSSDVTAESQNGRPAGDLTYWRFDERGRITGFYDNGYTQELAQVAIATFVNEPGLLAQGENMFLASANSGTVQYNLAGNNGAGIIRPGNLESSNVDMSDELASLIILQRSYQFNSRIITTGDEMIQEAIAMKR